MMEGDRGLRRKSSALVSSMGFDVTFIADVFVCNLII